MAVSSYKFRHVDFAMAGALVLILGTMLIPVPTPLLDVLLALSIGTGILVLMLTVELRDPLEFSSFPSLLLILTLFRLALNVATTRQILLHAFAGRVIQAFGDFVVGGNFVVGLVVFIILVVINFVVITRGAGRIAEVAARFTLDAMPGKQMSIDADLNQGLIDDKEALRRRRKLSEEADFYGAMDGASKFVRGDAIAGIIITVINIAGGFAIGMLQQGMSASKAISTYTILTVGDGLVAQVPALVVSTSAGILVTRAASDSNLGTQLTKQLMVHPKQLLTSGGILTALAIVPGLPFLPFMLLGGSLGGIGLTLRRRMPEHRAATAPAETREQAGGALDEQRKPVVPATAEQLKHVLAVSPMDLEFGFGLIPLVDRKQGGNLVERIGMLRTQVAEEMGVVLPAVNVRDNMNLRSNEYTIDVRGLEVARGTVQPGSLLAIDPSGEVRIEGRTPVKEPAFGFNAWWIAEEEREMAESKGLTIVDVSSVVMTHLTTVVKRNGADILTRQDTSTLVEQLKETNPAVVDELIPNKLTIGKIHRVLQHLLRERVSVRDLGAITEVLADHADKTQDPALLAELCRRILGGRICRDYIGPRGSLGAIGLHPDVESLLRMSTQQGGVGIGVLALDPSLAKALITSLDKELQAARKRGFEPVLLCSPVIRPQLRQLIQHDLNDTAVISSAEIPDNIQVEVLGILPAPEEVRRILDREKNDRENT